MRDTTLAKMVARAAASERAESADVSPAASLLVKLCKDFRDAEEKRGKTVRNRTYEGTIPVFN